MSTTRVLYRYLAGRPLDGRPRTDATYLHRGTRAVTLTGRASRWAYLPGWKRQLIRVTLPVTTAAAWPAGALLPSHTTATVAAVTATAAVHLLRRRRAARRFRRVYIAPTLAAIGTALGVEGVTLRVDPKLGSLTPRLAKPLSPAEQMVRAWYGQHVEPTVRWLPERGMRAWWAAQRFALPVTGKLELLRRPKPQDGGPQIRLAVDTPYLTADQRKLVSSIISAKVPVSDLVERWDQVGSQVTATWTVRRRPPTHVGYAELQEEFPKLKDWEFFLGGGPGGGPVIVSLRDDSPHIACSAGSGAGKSVLAQLIAVQVLARGGHVVILDRKGSHRWARKLPGVEYCTKAHQMHDALIRVAVLADERNTRAFDMPDEWDPGPRVFVIAEELNATFSQLREFWDEIREKGDPKVSPAVRAFREILFMGRSAKCHVFAVAQMLSANTAGGPEARENFGIRALARYTRNNWQMLCPEAAMPRASRTLGRWQIVIAGTATECQVAYLNAAQARAFARTYARVTGGPDAQNRPDSALACIVTGNLGGTGHMTGSVTADVTDPLGDLISISEAIADGILPWRKGAVKMRMQRAREQGRPVPEPAGRRGVQTLLYRRGDLVEWSEQEADRVA